MQRHRVGMPTWLALGLGTLPLLAQAHSEDAAGIGGGLLAGMLHPLLGLDHLVAMVAVGLWGAFLGPRAVWLLPVVFPLVMAVGGVLGMAQVPLPSVEVGIAVSGIVLGLMVALAARPPLPVAALIVGAFAIFHGHAHGAELPAAANALAYSIGFVVSTGLLHVAGIGLGLLVRWPAGRWAVRGTGLLIALVGLAFLVGR
ncbi:HupE/UreJ family protein [Aquabacterium sp. OR-4]|uniref:HupE/UreJ family protein n=1 Tax=Aquabacterium sp. OR-4 TaxID=2978127 RepID=UPI0021B1DEAC|nr:HupE/UreJ family protein [Aquabacterium sp. OR-4]MDT7835826.1 HupE/UreJ family protein [Aquabacterium sp. OR-4]